jgi:hypothetical protein
LLCRLLRSMRKHGAPAPGMEVATSSYTGDGRPRWLWHFDSPSSTDYELGVRLPMKTKLRFRSWQAMAVSTHYFLANGIPVAASIYALMLFRGNRRSIILHLMMAVQPMPLYLMRALFLEQLLDEGGKRWSGVHLPYQ